VLDRFLEPDIAELFERAADPDGAADGILVVGIEGEREIVAHQLAHGLCLGDVTWNIIVLTRAVAVPADLYGSRLFGLPALLDHANGFIDSAAGIVANRGIEGQFRTPGAAEQLVDWLVEVLALDVPEGNIEGGKRAGDGAFRAELYIFMQQPIVEDRLVERIRTDERGCEISDDAERVLAAHHRRGFAVADDAIFGRHAHESRAATRRLIGLPFHLKSFDGLDDRTHWHSLGERTFSAPVLLLRKASSNLHPYATRRLN
jgi:hypothetical protein